MRALPLFDRAGERGFPFETWAMGNCLGSCSYYGVGQYQAFGGAESELEGAVHLCGEHTTQDFQGYLNGAVFTGQRAAGEVLDEL